MVREDSRKKKVFITVVGGSQGPQDGDIQHFWESGKKGGKQNPRPRLGFPFGNLVGFKTPRKQEKFC